MHTYTISQLATLFGLSRSTLLYYDRVGLLPPSGRTGADYRYYSAKDHRRLARVCDLRRAGLSVKDIRIILNSRGKPCAAVVENRIRKTSDEILDLKNKQRLLSGMLTKAVSSDGAFGGDKELWVEMLRSAGMDDQAMASWHAEFEKRAPQRHQEFLEFLGISEKEIREIRQWSRKVESRRSNQPPKQPHAAA